MTVCSYLELYYSEVVRFGTIVLVQNPQPKNVNQLHVGGLTVISPPEFLLVLPKASLTVPYRLNKQNKTLDLELKSVGRWVFDFMFKLFPLLLS